MLRLAVIIVKAPTTWLGLWGCPAVGIGKPERQSHNLSGYWTRRITDEHRLVNQLRDEELIIVQARYHD